jgi:hypothetical protein
LYPAFQAAVIRLAVVIHYTFPPSTTKSGVFAAGEDDGVLHRDTTLIVVAVQCPGLKLPGRETPFMHPQVEGVLVVIAFRPNPLQP